MAEGVVSTSEERAPSLAEFCDSLAFGLEATFRRHGSLSGQG